MDIILSKNDEPHYYIGVCFSCGFFTIQFGKRRFDIWWIPPKSMRYEEDAKEFSEEFDPYDA